MGCGKHGENSSKLVWWFGFGKTNLFYQTFFVFYINDLQEGFGRFVYIYTGVYHPPPYISNKERRNARGRRASCFCLIGEHLISDGHGHTPMGCPGVRLEALQIITDCLRQPRPVTSPVAKPSFKGVGRRDPPTSELPNSARVPAKQYPRFSIRSQ